MNLAVVVEHNGRTRFARVKLPDVLSRFVPIPSEVVDQPGDSFAFLEDIVTLNIGTLFPGATVRGAHLFRIVRDTDMVIQEDEVRVLYGASQAGVSIDMIVRGVCCLRPGIPGVSDNIRVRSVVGRFLEHSRLYYFEHDGHPDVLIGSADLMERNLDRRVEALCYVRDADLRIHLREVVLETLLADTDRAMELQTDGTYLPAVHAGSEPVNAQEAFLGWYTERSDDSQGAHGAPRGRGVGHSGSPRSTRGGSGRSPD